MQEKVRNKKVLELVNRQGMEISVDDILSQKDGATLLNTGRAHIAHAMVKKGYVASVDEAFKKVSRQGYELLCSAKNVFA